MDNIRSTYAHWKFLVKRVLIFGLILLLQVQITSGQVPLPPVPPENIETTINVCKNIYFGASIQITKASLVAIVRETVKWFGLTPFEWITLICLTDTVLPFIEKGEYRKALNQTALTAFETIVQKTLSLVGLPASSAAVGAVAFVFDYFILKPINDTSEAALQGQWLQYKILRDVGISYQQIIASSQDSIISSYSVLSIGKNLNAHFKNGWICGIDKTIYEPTASMSLCTKLTGRLLSINFPIGESPEEILNWTAIVYQISQNKKQYESERNQILEQIKKITDNSTTCQASPRIFVLPKSGPQGKKFYVFWRSFSPNNTLTPHLQKPDGREFPVRTFETNQHGNAKFAIDSSTLPLGIYTL